MKRHARRAHGRRIGRVGRAMAVCALVLHFSAAEALAPTPQDGFEIETIAEGLNLPVGIAWAPDGQLFITEKAGVIKVREPDGQIKVVLDMTDDVNNFSDRGLLDVAVDKDFGENGWIYVVYAVDNPLDRDGEGRTISRLDRITVDENSQAVGARTTILGTYQPPADEFYCPRPHTNDVDCIPADQYWHTIGSVRVDPGDGTLWMGSGDALPPAEGAPDPIAFRTFDEQTYAGKLIHVDRGGKGVPGHPFCPDETDLSKVCTKLYAKGFRQPFRFAVRDTEPSEEPRTPDLGPLVGDVGWALREELDLTRPGRNYGWPCYEARVKPSPYREAQACIDLYALEGTDDAATGPSAQYHQRDAGGSVIAGPILRGGGYPAEFQNRIYYADYSNQWIRSAPFDPASDTIDEADDYRPVDFVENAGGVVDLEADPDGNLVYVDINTSSIRRIVHTTGNRAPTAGGSASPTNGAAPLAVSFSSAGSGDVDGDPITYHWDFGDGDSSTDADPTHTYTAVGEFTATLTVSDGDRTATKTFSITTANTAPEPTATVPATFRGGTVVRLSATATDAQDGEITDDDRFEWSIALVHNTHQHFIATLTGRDVEFDARADHDADSHYVVKLRVTDSHGLAAEEERRIDPETIELAVHSVPPGASFDYDGRTFTTPRSMRAAIGFRTTLSAAPTLVADGATYTFDSWSHGSPRTHALTVPSSDTTLTATYRRVPVDDGPPAATASPGTTPLTDPIAPPDLSGGGTPAAWRPVRLRSGPAGARASRRGVVRLAVVNDNATAAFGALTLTTTQQAAGRARQAPAGFRLAKRGFTIAPGQSTTVLVRLSRAEQRLLEARGKLRVSVSIKAGPRGQTTKAVTTGSTFLLAPRLATRR